MAITFNKDTKLLFVGDSVTDCGRSSDAESLGSGYVRIVRDYLRARHPPVAPMVLNRGMAGARLSQMAATWQRDVLSQRPDVLSILLGANETGSASAGTSESVDQFRNVYRAILSQTTDQLPRVRLVLCEPAALRSPVMSEADENLRPYFSSLMEFAREFDAECVVPLHAAFVYARRARPDIQWIDPNGQLSSSGHMIIAYTWMQETGVISSNFA